MSALFAETQGHPAGAWPPQAEADVIERPFVAALLIVNDQIAVLQTDFVEVLSVETRQAQAVEPIEARQQSVLRGACGRRCGCGGLDRWRRRRNGSRRRR